MPAQLVAGGNFAVAAVEGALRRHLPGNVHFVRTWDVQVWRQLASHTYHIEQWVVLALVVLGWAVVVPYNVLLLAVVDHTG
jgi:hypothetical protein